METRRRIASKITEKTDPAQGPHLATKEDYQIFEAREHTQEAIQARATVYEEMEHRIIEENRRPYPNKEYIERCRRIQEQFRCYSVSNANTPTK